jgi:hypothetical protein
MRNRHICRIAQLASYFSSHLADMRGNGEAFLAVYFVVHCAVQIMTALRHLALLAQLWSWPWMPMLAAVSSRDGPGSVAWALGLLVGINLFLSGPGIGHDRDCTPQPR